MLFKKTRERRRLNRQLERDLDEVIGPVVMDVLDDLRAQGFVGARAKSVDEITNLIIEDIRNNDELFSSVMGLYEGRFR